MKLQELFINSTKPILNIYFTAGYPHLESMNEILKGLEESGVDMVEIGMPYSDPLSDGPIIQNSSSVAIKNGINTDLIFDQLKNCNSKIPKILMGYFNALYVFGIENFCKRCKENEIEAVIIPDLPIEVYLDEYKTLFEAYGISPIFLITPETTNERIYFIDAISTKFIYVVSSSSTTGKGTSIQSAEDYLIRLQNMNLKNPLLVGFNISNKNDFDFVSNYTAGGIIGSAFIKYINNSKNVQNDSKTFVKSILQ